MKVVGVRFRKAGKVYYFDPLQFEIKHGSNVIVETARGIEFGNVIMGIRDVPEEKVMQPLKPVLRLATEEDERVQQENAAKEKEAFRICVEKIAKHNLEMKLIDCEYTFDNNKLLYYFTADGRVDFRELVKDLASVFKTRIELRQIGVRDETKILGGIGVCGRPLCCHTYLSDFIPVSIKMAKEQNLSLNPTKISGVCGRLMCCLKNEEEAYEELNSHLPGVGEFVTTADGLKGEVKSTSVLKQLVKVVVTLENDEKEIREYKVADLKFKQKRKNDYVKVDEELRELEQLEREDAKQSSDKNERNDNRGERQNRDQNRDQNRGEKNRGDKNRGDGERNRDRGNRPDKQNRGENGERGDRPNRGDGEKQNNERGEKQNRGDGERNRDRGNRPDKQNRGENGERGDRPNRKNRGNEQRPEANGGKRGNDDANQ